MTTPIKVLHIHFGKDGGAERFFVSLVQALGEKNVEQRFVIRPHRKWRDEIDDLGEIIENHYRRLSFCSLMLDWKLYRLVREWNPDAIMAWMPRAARAIPNWPNAVKLTRLGDFPANLKHFSSCDVLVGNMPGISSHCKSLGWDKPVQTITNFPPDILARPVSRSDLDTPDDVFLISGAGRFVPRKGFDLLVRAVARIPDAWLWLVGDGDERKNLERLANNLAISDRVRFTGWVREPIHYIASTDVFAMPSRHEPLGNVVLEAWRAKVPVIATRSEGPSWYMVNESNGLLVNIDDLDGFVNAINLLKYTSLVHAVVDGGYRDLESRFGKERIVNQYLELLSGNFGLQSFLPARKMRVIIINIAGETARMSFQHKQMESLGLDWERLEAVTPHTLSRPPDHVHWQRWERPMKAREMAILESHCKAWKRVENSGIPHLIIEDDAMLSTDVPTLLDKLEAESGLDHVTLEVRNRKKLVGRHHASLPLRRLYQDRTGAGAYVLWPSGARKLLKRASTRPALADAIICAAYEMETWQATPALAIQMDQCKTYSMIPPIRFVTPPPHSTTSLRKKIWCFVPLSLIVSAAF